MSKSRKEEYLRRMRVRGYEPSLAGMDDDDIEWELSRMDNAGRQKAEPKFSQVRPGVDYDFAKRIFKLFTRPFDPNWRMPDMSGPEFIKKGGNEAKMQNVDSASGNPYAGGYANGGAEGDMLFGVTGVTPMLYPNLTDEQKLFVSTVAGEVGGHGETAQRSVANIIMNRVGHPRFKYSDTVENVIKTPGQFTCYEKPNVPFTRMKNYLKNRDGSDRVMENIINTAMNVYHKKEPDNTGGAVLFYSPKAQAEQHERNSAEYLAPRPSDWNWDELYEVDVPGVTGENFRFYKYK